MKILSIGNSSSQDAQRWLHDTLRAVNLFIGDFSLQHHAANLRENLPEYDLEFNGGSLQRQNIHCRRSAFGKLGYRYPAAGQPGQRKAPYLCAYLTDLADAVRAAVPHAQIWLHQTWAYEQGAQHEGFLSYRCNQEEMFRRLTDAYEMASRLTGAPVIRVGETIQALREQIPAFDYAQTGRSLCRDGFHLSWDYGRYAAAAVWFEALTDGDIRRNSFVPQTEEGPAGTALLEVIQKTVQNVCTSATI